MKTLFSISLLIVIGSFTFATPSQNLRDFVKGELIVKFTEEIPGILIRDGVVRCGFPSIDELNERYGVYSIEKVFPNRGKTAKSHLLYDKIGLGRIYKLSFPKTVDMQQVVEEYNNDTYVAYTKPNFIITGTGTFPNDPAFPDSQWGLYQSSDADIDAPEAWDLVRGDSTIIVAVVDNGIDWDHPDLDARIWINSGEIPNNQTDDDGNGFIDDYRGWDFTKEWPGTQYTNGDDNPMDGNGHGTLVAGIIGAETDNNTGGAGVDWRCKLMAVKTLDGAYPGSGTYEEGARGIVYAANNGADVINMSWTCTSYNDTTEDAVEYAYGLGCVLVAASGNNGSSTPKIPAALDEVIAVGSTDTSDIRPSYSNYGNHLELVAPGGTTNSSPTGIYGTFWNNTYAWKYGTSFAAPHVSGVCALMLAKNSYLTYDDLRDILHHTSDDQIGDPSEDVAGWDQYHGYGRLNAYRAVLMGWIDDMRLTNQSSWSNNPALAMIHRDVHIVWEDGRDGGSVYYKRSSDGGDNWGSDVSLVPYASFPDNPDIAVQEKNVYVVYNDIVWWDIYLKKSTDGGQNWGSGTAITSSSGSSSNPSIAVYQKDIHVVWEDSRDGNWRIYYKRSTDGGQTWSSETALSASGSCASYSPDIAIYEQDVYVVWYYTSASAKRVYHRHSSNGGSTWDASQNLSTLTTSTWLTPQVAASDTGAHIVWSDFIFGGNEEVWFASSFDKGQLWGVGYATSNDGFKSISPRVAVEGETVHIIWVDWRDRAGDLNEEIYYRKGNGVGASWAWDTPEFRLTGNSARSSQSSIGLKGNQVHVNWSDARDGNDEIYYKRYSPWITVSIAPDSSIVEVPRNGSMGYTATIVNHTSIRQTIKAWTDATLPNGNHYGPVQGPVNLVMQPNQTRTFHLSQDIPGNAPYWTYRYNAYVGYTYPNILDFDSFVFTVVQSGFDFNQEKPIFDHLDFSGEFIDDEEVQ